LTRILEQTVAFQLLSSANKWYRLL